MCGTFRVEIEYYTSPSVMGNMRLQPWHWTAQAADSSLAQGEETSRWVSGVRTLCLLISEIVSSAGSLLHTDVELHEWAMPAAHANPPRD